MCREKTPEICELARRGIYRTTICRLAGVHRRTFYRWIDVGESDLDSETVTVYSEFVRQLRIAEGEAELRAVDVIAKAALNGDWGAAAWWLTHGPARSNWTDHAPPGSQVQAAQIHVHVAE